MSETHVVSSRDQVLCMLAHLHTLVNVISDSCAFPAMTSQNVKQEHL